MDIASLPARDRILLTAHDLFYREGIRATGIDRVIAASGVAKLTFYRHFASKDLLVEAFLDYRHDRWMAWFVDALGRRGAADLPADGRALPLLADVLDEWCADPAFRGCAFVNAVAEVGGTLPRATAQAAAHKQAMADVVALLLPPGDAGARCARAAVVAFDGAVVQAQMGDAPGAVAALRALLEALAGTVVAVGGQPDRQLSKR
ncbi:TetR/AcrR family transcriptional regulator [uncultured Xylophilus sp.]|uniref:TetR/AcrR family transcriptional regulator n=1 Tax=uncultured Xylophilus sp. TaxID=296832 RepID=UPI0025ED64AA|nr:TetR/AcrR family transcriptional regulator [uncultured Xylophilus sp.]